MHGTGTDSGPTPRGGLETAHGAVHGTTDVQVGSQKWPLWPTAANAGLCITGILTIAVQLVGLRERAAPYDYPLSSWLTNYGAGLTRRGLVGEVLTRVPGVDAKTAVLWWTSVLAVIVLTAFAVLVQRLVHRTGSPWPPVLWLAPAGLLMGNLQTKWLEVVPEFSAYALRPEYLVYAILLFAVLSADHAVTPQLRTLWAAVFGALLAVLVFAHEALAIVAVAATLMFVAATRRQGWRWSHAALITVPAMLVTSVLLASTYEPLPSEPQATDAAANAMWAQVDAPTQAWLGSKLPVALSAATSGAPTEALALIRALYLDSGIWRLWLVTWLVTTVWCLVALVLLDRSRASLGWLVGTTVVVNAAELPMFALGTDWGRWIVVASTVITITIGGRLLLSDPDQIKSVHGERVWPIVLLLALTSLFWGVPETGIHPVPWNR